MTIKRLVHISVVVDDLPAAVAFFKELGMTVEGEAPVVGERVPKQALGLGRIAAQQPRQPAHRATLARSSMLGVFGEQCAKRLCLLAVQDAAACRPLRR